MDPPAPFHPEATRRVRQQMVRVGVGVIVVVDNIDGDGDEQTARIYVGVRKGSHGAGSLALPGGHLEMYESWEACAKREIMEEMGLDLDLNRIEFAHVTNDVMSNEEKHYVTIFMMTRLPPGSPIPTNTEPHKCEGWEAYTWSDLASMLTSGERLLFGPLKQLVQDQPSAVLDFLKQGRQVLHR